MYGGTAVGGRSTTEYSVRRDSCRCTAALYSVRTVYGGVVQCTAVYGREYSRCTTVYGREYSRCTTVYSSVRQGVQSVYSRCTAVYGREQSVYHGVRQCTAGVRQCVPRRPLRSVWLVILYWFRRPVSGWCSMATVGSPWLPMAARVSPTVMPCYSPSATASDGAGSWQSPHLRTHLTVS